MFSSKRIEVYAINVATITLRQFNSINWSSFVVQTLNFRDLNQICHSVPKEESFEH